MTLKSCEEITGKYETTQKRFLKYSQTRGFPTDHWEGLHFIANESEGLTSASAVTCV